ncbi:MAG: hypothetical protein Q9171_003337 [Xanthocarpia ochracea]
MQFPTLILALFTATLASALPNPHPPRDHGPIEPRAHPRVCPSADYCASNPAGLPDSLNPAIPHSKEPTTLLTETSRAYTTITGTTTATKEEETTSYTTIISTRTSATEVETSKPDKDLGSAKRDDDDFMHFDDGDGDGEGGYAFAQGGVGAFVSSFSTG